ncbi:sulfatase [Algoriphagus machipongonensis]|uniref:Sulfatase family protein n=1 Tax=Algoriphagus machipongonensis TaxID=388413 RepID=A3HWG0_9BACT|nr:sulfatase [Algoriphagus machipongonensis]EAZ80933.1 sulfatase family protein [Algoriphagus machipongonensis]
MQKILIFITFLLSISSYAQEAKKPNVLFIIADDLTTTAIGAYGNPVPKTPVIDQLAKESTVFSHAYSQYPVCGPSRASMMFGYYPSATQTYGYVSGRKNVGSDRPSLAELFKEKGYYTARVSKIYHMGVPGDIEKGSDGQDDPASWTEKFNSKGPEWTAEGKAELVQNNPDGSIERKGGNVMTIVQADGDDLVHSDGKTAKKASELIREHKDEPFFLAVGFVRPHVPFVAPASYFDPYPFAKITTPKQAPNDWEDIPERGINYVTSVNAEMNQEQKQKAIAAYYASVSYMDTQVGKVLTTLKEEGLENNTIIVFTSDHGFHLGEHEFWMKVSLHEESVKVPMMIKVPGKNPAVVHSFTELIDLYPTLADLAGLDYPKAIQGKSLKPLIENPNKKVRDMAFSVSQGGRSFLVRTEKWAYIQYNEDASAGMELFDMENDPKQFNNLANDPAYSKALKEMQSRLIQKLKKVRKNDLEIDYNSAK